MENNNKENIKTVAKQMNKQIQDLLATKKQISNEQLIELEIKRLLTIMINRDEQDNVGDTLLHHAVRSASFNTVEYLIKKGEDVNSENIFGDTPLDLALLFRKNEIATLLKKEEEKDRQQILLQNLLDEDARQMKENKELEIKMINDFIAATDNYRLMIEKLELITGKDLIATTDCHKLIIEKLELIIGKIKEGKD
jgi:hypothetical protein